MKLLGYRTCPVWEDEDGTRRVGTEAEPDHPPVVGWCNVVEVEINGRVYELLLCHQVAA